MDLLNRLRAKLAALDLMQDYEDMPSEVLAGIKHELGAEIGRFLAEATPEQLRDYYDGERRRLGEKTFRAGDRVQIREGNDPNAVEGVVTSVEEHHVNLDVDDTIRQFRKELCQAQRGEELEALTSYLRQLAKG
jgi:hypothetical protein